VLYLRSAGKRPVTGDGAEITKLMDFHETSNPNVHHGVTERTGKHLVIYAFPVLTVSAAGF
jgi:hypothetical protein